MTAAKDKPKPEAKKTEVGKEPEGTANLAGDASQADDVEQDDAAAEIEPGVYEAVDNVGVNKLVKYFQTDAPTMDPNNPGYRLLGAGPYTAIITYQKKGEKTAHLYVMAPFTPGRHVADIPHKSIKADDAIAWWE